ncbi:MAG: response regulator [Terrimicrobiaceae bacterium]
MPDSQHILVVDDEPLALKYFLKTFGGRYRIHTASSLPAALVVLGTCGGQIGVVVSDQRMPGGNGLDLLGHVREHFPGSLGILTTAYSDVETLVRAINSGAVFSFVSKPWNIPELEDTLARAFACRGAIVREREADGHARPTFQQSALDHSVTRSALIASKIGHYVNNAICPVVFLIDQLIGNYRATESLPLEFLQSLKKHITEVTSTLAELQEISGTISRDSFDSVDIGVILDGVLRETALMREQRKLSLEIQAEGNIPPVCGVAAQIEKMLRFMIAEELVSLPPGSRVSVRLSAEEQSSRGRCVKLEFEDYVPLVGVKSAANLLHPFHLRGTDPRQFGVFLVSCFFIAKNHGGRLTSETKKTDGLIYSIVLPRAVLSEKH